MTQDGSLSASGLPIAAGRVLSRRLAGLSVRSNNVSMIWVVVLHRWASWDGHGTGRYLKTAPGAYGLGVV